MPWIDVVDYSEATGLLKKLYDEVMTPNHHIDNILKIHSLRPRTLEAHLFLYKTTLHSKPNELSNRERELIGVCVSLLNGCTYCVDHHTAGLGGIVGSQELAKKLAEESIMSTSKYLTAKERIMCDYTIKLTKTPEKMNSNDLSNLRKHNMSDSEILDLNQIVAYFAYANRTAQGLGVEIAGEKLGYHPSEDKEGYEHG